jgi:sulfite exporter TauE/SafE
MTHGFPIALAASTADHASHAAIAAPATAETLIAALFLAGLAGGAAHCAGMCGPFVLAQTAGRLGAVPAERFGRLTRLGGALLLPYHLGRMTTYAGLGALGAALAGSLSELAWLGWLKVALLGVAALLMLAAALEKAELRLPKPAAGRLARLSTRLARPLLAGPAGPGRGFALGIALGFLPCGFLYGALAAAAAGGDPIIGAAAMAAFALGTAPSLFAVALLGEAAGRRWRLLAARFAPAAFTANAVILAWTAWIAAT